MRSSMIARGGTKISLYLLLLFYVFRRHDLISVCDLGKKRMLLVSDFVKRKMFIGCLKKDFYFLGNYFIGFYKF